MGARPLIIDCDPGQDDAIALLMAIASPEEFDLLGVTAVAGNVPLAKTEANARRVRDVAGRANLPVYAGCPRPMVRAPVTAEAVHGPSGIDGADLPEPSRPAEEMHAVDFLVQTLGQASRPVTLATLGPLTTSSSTASVTRLIRSGDTVTPYSSSRWLRISRTVRPRAYSDRTRASKPSRRRVPFGTIAGSNVPLRSRGTANVALAIIKNPSILDNVAEIVAMGGAVGPGNVTPAAEFNIYADPHAAHVVFEAGVPLTMVGLDVTSPVRRLRRRRASRRSGHWGRRPRPRCAACSSTTVRAPRLPIATARRSMIRA